MIIETTACFARFWQLLLLGVCWMLTAPDGRADGRHLAYLDNPRKFRLFDDELFDWLKETIRQHPEWRTARIEASEMLAGCVFCGTACRRACTSECLVRWLPPATRRMHATARRGFGP